MMRKIINEPERFVDEVLEGIVLAHPQAYQFTSRNRRAVVDAAGRRPGQVGIVTGGGSGHLPLFLGYVGPGLATAVAVGNVFSSPSPETILDATRAANAGAGVLYLYGNYGGDIYNFDLAAEVARSEGIATRTVLGNDDILSASAEAAVTRRGVAGLVFAYKVAGAAAARGDDLDAVARIAAHCVSHTRTAGVGLAPTILPAAGQPTFKVAEGHMEVGIGIHGEAGIASTPLESADQIAARLMGHITSEIPLSPGLRLAVLVNGLGATPPEELYLLFRAVHGIAASSGAVVARAYVGGYATSLEMAGASVSVLALDDELEALLGATASSPFYRDGTVAAEHPLPELAASDAAGADGTAQYPQRDFESRLRTAALAVTATWPGHAPELRQLDADLGDGDLGITVSAGSGAVAALLARLPADVAAGALLREAGLAFASANPSTFAALVGGGLASAATAFDDTRPVTVRDGIRIGRAFADFVARKGGAEPGDKTLLDILVPVLDALDAAPDDPGGAAALAWELVSRTAQWQSKRGRAAWHRDRSIGRKDPGSVAIAYLLDTVLCGMDPVKAPSRSESER